MQDRPLRSEKEHTYLSMYPPLLLKEIASVNSNQIVVYLVHHGESLVLPSDF